MDMEQGYGDGENPVVLKSEFLLSLCEQLMGDRLLSAKEKSIIDHNDDIVIGGECQIDHLPLGSKGLAGAGHAQEALHPQLAADGRPGDRPPPGPAADRRPADAHHRMALIWLGEVAEMLITSPPSPSIRGRYSDSGSITMISSSVENVIPVPTDEAVREMQNRLLGVETNVTNWQRRCWSCPSPCP